MIGNAFSFERRFKVDMVVSVDNQATTLAELEGCYLNEPFNTHIIGQYRGQDKDGKANVQNFAL